MKKAYWKKTAAALLAVILAAGCSAKKSEESASQHTEPEKTAEPARTPETTPAPTPEPTPTPEPEPEVVHEFDPATNQVISFGEFQLQIPHEWKEGNDGWYAMRNGTAEAGVSVILDASGTEEASDEYLLNDPSIFGRLFTGGTYDPTSDGAVTVNGMTCRRAVISTSRGEAPVTMYIEAALCSDPTQIAYVIAYEPTDTAYDFSADLQDILNSLIRSVQPAAE
ncbi:MAG: hypothetical protein IKG46_04810 [Solobacterium sp.]|nr:hypothetical protein [Solobacterium sp.]